MNMREAALDPGERTQRSRKDGRIPVPRIGIVKIESSRRLLDMLSAGATRISRIRIEEEPSPSYPDILCDMQESSCRSTPGALNTALDRWITAVAGELGGGKTPVV